MPFAQVSPIGRTGQLIQDGVATKTHDYLCAAGWSAQRQRSAHPGRSQLCLLVERAKRLGCLHPAFVGLRNLAASSSDMGLWVYRDIAGPAAEVGAILGLHGLEAMRDAIDGWHIGVFELGQTGHASVAALWAA